MSIRGLRLSTAIVICAVAASACAPVKRVIVQPAQPQASAPAAQQTTTRRVVRRPAAQTVRTTTRVRQPTPVAAPAPAVRASAPDPVVPVATRVTPAKKDCSVAGTPGCPAVPAFGFEGGQGDGGGGGGGGGGGWDG
ncbi:MAG: hypothetical protein AAGA08_00970 [Pseudomonadota bacterium]